MSMSSEDPSKIIIGKTLVKRSDYEKILGVEVYYKLTFGDHMKDFCRKIDYKL